MALATRAPGTYVRTGTSPQPASTVPILSLRNYYQLVEVPESASINISNGLPYNIPTYISSLEDYANRIGGVPTSGPELISYNELKNVFRHSPTNTPVYVIRVKSVNGVRVDLLRPVRFPSVNGEDEDTYAYPIEINGYKLGLVNYDAQNVETHYGVIVQPSVTSEQAVQQVIDAITADPVLSQSIRVQTNIYARISSTAIEIYPRLYGGEVDVIFNLPPNTPIDQGGIVTPINPNDEIAETTRPRVEPRDYIHTLETAFDPTIDQPGFIALGAAYFKFRPVDRLAVYLSSQALVSRNEFEWVNLVSSMPTDGNPIALHYGYRYFDILDSVLTSSGLNSDHPGDIFYVRQLNEFYRLANTANGLPQDTIGLEDINLSYKQTTVIQVRPVSNMLSPGQVITNALKTVCYGVVNDFNISALSWPLSQAQIDNAIISKHLVGPLKVLVHNESSTPVVESSLRFNVTDAEAASVTSLSFTLTISATIYNFIIDGPFTDVEDLLIKLRNKFLTDGQGLYYVLELDFVANSHITLSNPDAGVFSAIMIAGDVPIAPGIYTPGIAPMELPYLFAGQLIESNSTVYFVTRYFQSQSVFLPQIIQQNNLVLRVPDVFYSIWVEANIRNGRIRVAAYNPDTDLAFGSFTGFFNGQRSVKYNATSHQDFIPDRLMYDSPFGHSFYSYPPVIDLEQFETPSTAFVAGVYFTKSFTEGFQIAPAGTGWPLQALGTSINVTTADQDITNNLGMNAIRRIGSSYVVYGGRTLSSNNLFNETNTRFLLSSLIQSSRNLFTGYVFELNDANLVYSEVAGIANGFLRAYFNIGAFQGASPTEAYQVSTANNNAQTILEKNIFVDAWVIPRGLTERVYFTINVAAPGSLPRLGV